MVRNNGGTGINANSNGTQTISNNIIYGNGGYGIWSRGNGTYTINNNIIVNNTNVGVHGIYTTHIITNNIIANNGGAIEISQGGDYTISNNQILFNNNNSDGSGFDPRGETSQSAWSPSVSIIHNLFSGNISTNATILSFSPSYSGDPSFDLNNNNIIDNVSTYAFRNYRESSLFQM